LDNGVPRSGGGTLAVIGDLKQMKPRWLVGASMLGYGCTLTVGIGIPIPVLSEEIVHYTAVSDDEIFAPVVDYGVAYPALEPGTLGEVSYAELKSGKIVVQGREMPTASLSSYSRALEIASTLKEWILSGRFYLTEPVVPLHQAGSDVAVKSLKERPIE
jgi:uncharacterized protein (DUF39 family)